ncbi:hypothetical protein GCM10027036_19370 [Flavihumibacter cheonanensis]|uniref:hypothetical protein n=1 Tax=Flavihumibacter cheonanensis TaxID=1442385 RepID=UPI001EF80AE7|nr:hypothetical protein [Flavihumibacter cheonanensis]MCG7754071.1 hypothetical protein [Flavihumibacter cheonanensis]
METSSYQDLREIRQMMEKSSRFISLSGWSGIAAGFSALAGAFFANRYIKAYYANAYGTPDACPACLKQDLIVIAGLVFISALVLAFFFTYTRSKKDGVAIWGTTARKLLWNTMLPMAIGAVFIFHLMEMQYYSLVGASSLLFYGLALVNGSKYTLGEIRFLGYGQLLTGLYCLWFPGNGLAAWAFGFGILHIVYGIAMWWKYERN